MTAPSLLAPQAPIRCTWVPRLHSWDNISPINKYVENILRICWEHIEGAQLLTMSWLPKISRTDCPQCRSRRCQRRWDHHPLQGGWQQSGAPCPATPRWDNKYNIYIYICTLHANKLQISLETNEASSIEELVLGANQKNVNVVLWVSKNLTRRLRCEYHPKTKATSKLFRCFNVLYG